MRLPRDLSGADLVKRFGGPIWICGPDRFAVLDPGVVRPFVAWRLLVMVFLPTIYLGREE